jgi:hypothetical protein
VSGPAEDRPMVGRAFCGLGQHMFTFSTEHTLAMPYLIDWLDVSAVSVCIATTPAFPHGGNLHDVRRQRQGCGVVQGGK